MPGARAATVRAPPPRVGTVTETKKIPLLDLCRQDGERLDALRAAFERVLASGHFILGPEVEAFERECAEFLGSPFAIGVSSGTDALLLALMALGIGPGDEVICPAYTFFASAGSIWRTGAKPVFVDIDPGTFNCTAEAIGRAITERTKAIMPVHLYGRCCDMAGIMAVASERRIPVVEDAAQAIGATRDGKAAGTFGTFGCFSFFPSKNLGCLGDGGLLTANDADLAERARVLRVHGGKPKYHHSLVGANFRLDALQAAFLRAKLPHLSADTERRRRNAALYERSFRAAGIAADRSLGSSVVLPEIVPGHIVNQYVIRTGGGRRDALRDALQRQGIGTEIYYPIPLHLQPCFAPLGYSQGDFPESERAARETLALPVFPELRADEIERVVAAIAGFLRA
ncbi:MAG: DegT/DnrJ/EryC1/StrS family aminotransferase [Planctomycetota bacterium]